MPSEFGHEESLREIVTRVVENGKDYARAEVNLAKQTALAKVGAIRPAAILLVCALLLVQAGLTVLAAALGMALAIWLGVAGGLAAGAVIVLLIAGLLALSAVSKLKRAF